MKANNYDQVVKELEVLGFSKDAVKNEIKECDKGHFHVITVRIEQGVGMKNKGFLVVNRYHKAGYDKIMKGFVALGYHKVILLHDPTVKNGEDSKKIFPKKVESQEDIQKRIDAEVERRVQLRMEALEKKNPVSKNVEDDNGGSEGDSDIEGIIGKTIAEMTEFAKFKEIDLTGLKKFDDIKGAIVESLKDNEEEK